MWASTIFEALAAAVPQVFQKTRKHLSTGTNDAKNNTAIVRGTLLWTEFTIHNLMAQYGTMLLNTTCDVYIQTAVPLTIADEKGLEDRFSQYIAPRMRAILRETCARLGLRHITIDVGGQGANTGWHPDRGVFYVLDIPNACNLCPGEIKPSWVFHTAMILDYPRGYDKYFLVMKQIMMYMIAYQVSYGFICTEKEFVAVRIDPSDQQQLLLSEPVSWSASRTRTAPKMTLMLALWYLIMMAEEDYRRRPEQF